MATDAGAASTPLARAPVPDRTGALAGPVVRQEKPVHPGTAI